MSAEVTNDQNPWTGPETSLQCRYDDDRLITIELITIEPSHNYEVGVRIGEQEIIWVDALDLLRVVSHTVLEIVYGPSPTEKPRVPDADGE